MFHHWHLPDLNSAQKWALEKSIKITLCDVNSGLLHYTNTKILQHFQIIYHPVPILK